ncbi:hypothetical protein ACJQWK_02252 [Exserohilum turcicum]|uniref:Uncharacterized protein n=1 Tax=Exserohilum turcicum (strain 28A) TaxID=671987 RepID=R0KIE1_EXST2|nr:uncharacterized protein SETTUDRAFT_28109 [Exserohilum turcica Et28A]EOA87817.1 hypothetical protein SETTUDRAFT_28109 [Exserohilum turcica Et28A]
MELSDSTSTATTPFAHTPDNDGTNQDNSAATPQKHVQHRTKAPTTGKRPQFMQHIPSNEYAFPAGGVINATIVDIIVLLPQWFRNPGILFRLLNNNITSGVHFAILDEHRHLNIHHTDEVERARDHLSDTYRRVMRKVEPGWTKARHRAPEDWDEFAMSIHNFVPEAADKVRYIVPPSIPFRDLATGLKKLPQGADAGDLTRALAYAMQNQKVDGYGHVSEFMFPDDIHVVLELAGRTHITQDHLDRVVVTRYALALRSADTARRKQVTEDRQMQENGAGNIGTQAVCVDQPYSVPSAQNAVGHSLYQASYGDMPVQTYAPQQMQAAPNFSKMQGVYHGMTSRHIGPLMPISTQQWRTPGYSIPGTELGQYSFSHSHAQERARSHAQVAAASIASELVARGSEAAAVGFPGIPDVCTYDEVGTQHQAWDSADMLQFPQDWTGEQQMEALMAANQTLDTSGLPTPFSSPPQHTSWMQQQAMDATGLSPPPQTTKGVDENGLSLPSHDL